MSKVKNSPVIEYGKLTKSRKLFTGRKTVLVGGCFDIVHFGHLEFLKKAALKGDYLIVVLESDEFIKKNKRKEPVHPQNERGLILSYLKMVDLVIKIPFFKSDEDYLNLVKAISPRVIAVTGGDPQLKNKKKQALLTGAKVVTVTKLVKKYSTRRILGEY